MKLILASLAVMLVSGNPVDTTQLALSDVSPEINMIESEAHSDIESRIYGGEPAKKGQIPWQAHLTIKECPKSNSKYYKSKCQLSSCGATLISDQHLITAGHCLLSYDENILMEATRIVVRLGSTKKGYGKAITTTCFKNHQKWNSYSPEVRNDIAIIYLPYSLKETSGYLDYISPISLPFNDEDFVDENAIASGFGKTEEEENTQLKYVAMKVMSNFECNQEFNITRIPKSQICARTLYGDTCSGDSGGPLFIQKKLKGGKVKNILIGVTSYGPNGCGVDPSVFTRVTHYMSFIRKNIKPPTECKLQGARY